MSLFETMQGLLQNSSLDKESSNKGLRYDQYTNQQFLKEKDRTDKQVAELAERLMKKFDSLFEEEVVNKKFPIKYKVPMNNVINRELMAYRRLIDTIRDSVLELLKSFNDESVRPLEIEHLWNQI